MNAMLNEESLASGGPTADYKVLCDGSGVRVDSIVTSGSDFSSIVSATNAFLSHEGGASSVDRTIFFDGTQNGTCGLGSFVPDERPDPGNQNNAGGASAVVYRPCWSAEVAMHENGHNQGAVQAGAPDSTGSGAHCYDEEDVMCYSPDGGDRHQDGTVDRCLDRVHFDCGFDDYFNSSPQPGGYLATHWNVGSRANRFIVFGSGSQPVPMLRRGRWQAGYSGPTGSWRFFKFKAPPRKRLLRFELAGCAAPGCQPNLDLYVRPRREPTLGRFKKRSRGPSSAERTKKIKRPKKGIWYAGVFTQSGGEPAPFSIRATLR
jgi:hypothetical protein